MILLNVQTGFTFLSSTILGNTLSQALSERGQTLVGIANVNTMFDALEVHHALVKKGIGMILGMTLKIRYDSETLVDGVIYSTNDQGVISLKKLTQIISKPAGEITLSQLLKLDSSGLVFIEPSLHGYIATQKVAQNSDLIYAHFLALKKHFKSVYIGLNKAMSEGEQKWHTQLRLFVKEHEMEILAFPRIRALKSDDVALIDVMNTIKTGTNETLLSSVAEVLETIQPTDFLPSEWELTEKLASQWVWKPLKSGKRPMPYKVQQEGVDLSSFLKALAQRGLERRLKTTKIPRSYLERLEHELSVIDKLGYADYFLVVYDYVKFAKTNQIIVGPGRGSGAASLVCYTLGITDVDPLKYGLLFERFLNPERVTMPDIDVDFQDDRRQEVIAYLKDKYGSDHFAHVVAFTRFQAKSALRDVGKALSIPLAEVDRITKMVPSTLSLRDFHQQDVGFRAALETNLLYQKWYQYASSIEELPRQTTLHAAGVVVSLDPISSCTPVYAHETNVQTTQYDMSYIEEDGLLKMDILGLKNLSIIDATLKSIRQSTHKDFSLSDISLDDPKVYQLIRTGRTSGIFQLESGGIINEAIKVVKPENFEDIVSILALFRPGPKDFIPTYARRKHGQESYSIQPKVLEPILKPTYGIIVYQEQIMQIVQVMAGFSLGKADVVRRAISKKKEAELLIIRNEFIKGALERGHQEAEATSVYDMILRFADYGFARAHAVAYAVVSVQMAYLKTYYPVHFYASVLNTFALGANDSKLVDYIREIKRLGIVINKPSINHSHANFIVTEDGHLQYALTAINGVGTALVESIGIARMKSPFTSFFDVITRIPSKLRQTKSLSALIDAGAFDDFNMSRSTCLANLSSAINYAQLIEQSQNGLLPIRLDPPRLIKAPDDQSLQLEREYAVLGTYLSGFPLESRRTQLSKEGYLTLQEILAKQSGTFKSVVYIKAVKMIKTKKGDAMALVEVIDETELTTVPIFPTLFQSVLPQLKVATFVIMEGKIEWRDGVISLVVFRLAQESRNVE